MVNKIAKGLNHKLSKIIDDDLPANGLSLGDLLKQRYSNFSGNQMIEILEAAYMECRYPMPSNISNKFPTRFKGINWDPLNSTEPEKFAYDIARFILKKIENDFFISNSFEIPAEGIQLTDWQNFCHYFFGSHGTNT